MEKRCCIVYTLTLIILICSNEQVEGQDFYNLFATDIFDNIVSFDKYRGTVTLVVNVASECGYTDGHYRSLNTLVDLFHKTKKFNVLAFPCNQFGNQEPGTLNQIRNFAYDRMKARFPLFSKVDVKGEHRSEVYNYLIEQSGHTPTWNFWKYLIDHDGSVSGAWGPTVGPDDLYQVIKEHIDDIPPPVKRAVKKKKKSKKKQQKDSDTDHLEQGKGKEEL